MVKLRKEEDLGAISEELDKDLTRRYAIEDVTSTKKRFQYGAIVLLIALLVVGSFLFYIQQRSIQSKENFSVDSKMELSDMTVTEGEKTIDWTYKQFMAVPFKGMSIEKFVMTYGKATEASQSMTTEDSGIFLTYTYYDQDRIDFADFYFEKDSSGTYDLVMKTANNFLKKQVAQKSKTSQQKWTKEAYDNLQVTHLDTKVKGITLDNVLKTYGEPEGDSVIAMDDESVIVVLDYLSYQDGELLKLTFEKTGDGGLRLSSKDNFAEITVDDN